MNISSPLNPSPYLPEELDNGNLEYKLKLTDITPEKLQKRITQMKFRLREGNGICRYLLGVEDSGNPLGISSLEMQSSIDTIKQMTSSIQATITKVEYFQGKTGIVAEITITQSSSSSMMMMLPQQHLLEIKIGIIGEENSGKSTLIGCLISDKKDNGKGLSRINVFRHKHEMTCGKTSSFTHQIIGFDKNGKKTNINTFGHISPWQTIVNQSVKIINFIDMGCSEKSLNNSLKAFSPTYLDYTFLVISAVDGITNNTLLFLKIALSINKPVIVIITKVDLVNEEDIKIVLCNFNIVLKKEKSGKNPLVVNNKEDIVNFANNINECIMPMFLISNKSGFGLDLLNNFLSILPTVDNTSNDIGNSSSMDNENDDEYFKAEFHFLEIINKDNKGNIIIEGIVTKGTIYKGEEYKCGPLDNNNNSNKKYTLCKVVNIHCKKMEVHSAFKGQFCSIEIEKCGHELRTGMVLIGLKCEEIKVKKFKAELWSMINDKDIKLKLSYQPLVHIEHICQCVKLLSTTNNTNNNSKDDSNNYITIPNGSSIEIEMEFLYHHEYIKKNSFLIIVDNAIQIYGYVKEIYI